MPTRRPITGTPYLIQTPGIRSALQSIQADVDSRTHTARRLIGDEAVRTIRKPGTSKVNVDTGTMRSSFFFTVSRGNNRIDIFNRARSRKGFRYPILIERRYRGVERTLTANRSRIAARARRDLERYTDTPPRRLPYELRATRGR